MLDLCILWAVSGLALSAAGEEKAQEAVRPLARAHAHNDYHHPRPLRDALSHGFSSVEADVFLVGENLLVAHDPEELRLERTLEALYLDPLRERVRENHGGVYPGGPPFTLLIDIKSDGAATYAALSRLLVGYAEMLTTIRDGVLETKAVTVVISGNRPRGLVAAQKVRYAGIDGRLSDMDSTDASHLLPLISDNWTKHFEWRGSGPFPEDDRRKLREIVRKSHAKGRNVRFWSTPESPILWRELVDAGVDLISTDRLGELQAFLLKEKDTDEDSRR